MGKKWHDSAEIARDSRVYAAFVLVLSGVAAWDVIRTIDFDFSIVRGKRPWRWTMLMYFVVRICMILHIFAMAVNLNAIDEIPCQGVTWISKVTDAIGTCCSSLILVLRTRAVWHRDFKITVGLGLLFCGQIAIWCQTFRYSIARWDPTRKCSHIVAMAFDLIILILCAFRLCRNRRTSGLSALLLRDGILYFCAVFCANLVQMIMACLVLNPVLNIIALPFALVVSAIAATTVFRNVFIRYDASSSENSGNDLSDNRVNRLATPRIHLTSVTSHHVMSNDIPLGEYKSTYSNHQHHLSSQGGISTHKVVDVDVEPPSTDTLSHDSMHDNTRAF
ncbi:hypothetical protein AN958_00701 [Leucoagaricus sp. SymC.cos]|nr:hypothetical protein AN958_00701 [Leucoagaricus sp. SymC.cos]